MALLDAVKIALRITTDAFDSELTGLIGAAKLDLGIAGVLLPTELDDITGVLLPTELDDISNLAIITFCRLHFGQPDDYDRLKKSYDEQKAQLATCTGYTDWGDS